MAVGRANPSHVPFGIWIVVAAAAGAFWSIDQPYRTTRERAAARGGTCDRLYTDLRDEARVELGTAARARTGGTCHEIDAEGVVRCLVRRNSQPDNPRNRNQSAYTSGAVSSCQVQLEPAGPRAIRFSQVRDPGAATRTFSIRID